MEFNLVFNRELIFGENSVSQLPEILEKKSVKKVFLASFDTHFEAFENLADLLRKNNIDFIPYVIASEPDLHIIDEGAKLFNDKSCDCTLALGGGSVIDAAKAIGMLAKNGGCIEDYQIRGRKVTVEPPLFIAIPTTSGTGAEATKTSVVINNNTHLKKSLYDNSMIADVVILDPNLVKKLPKRLTAATGMDALSHGVESYVSLNANPITEIYSLKTIELVSKYLKRAYDNPEDMEARSGMLLASYLGGRAIAAGIGIAHIMAQPLGGTYHIPHGDACSIFLPISMEANFNFALHKYAEVAKALGVYDINCSDEENAKKAIARVRELQSEIDAPVSLRPYAKEIPDILDTIVDIVERTTGHIKVNPRPLDRDLIIETYKQAMSL